MSRERDIIARTRQPATVESLRRDLAALGVAEGMVLLVHSSLSALGWVCGGAVAVVAALEAALGERGTLVMPTHTASLSDPAEWVNPPVPPGWWPTIRDAMPAFDPAHTPTEGMGRIVEVFRQRAGARRSGHPQVSFCARGPEAERIVGAHSLDYGLGEGSPLARVYELDGRVLLLGVGHGNNTSFHLAEYRAEFAGKAVVRNGAPVMTGAGRRWAALEDVEIEEGDFARLGADFEARAGRVVVGRVALAEARLFAQRAAVDFAVGWMGRNRA